MLRLIALINALLVFSFTFAVQATEEPITFGMKHSITSHILGEERHYYITLPESYQWAKTYRKYPVVYILDGNWYFTPFAAAAKQMAADVSPHIPEMIIVGVSNDNQRVRDASPTNSLIGYEAIEDNGYSSSGGADKFLDFLALELIPRINDQYAASDYRILTGYSFNGLPVLHSLLTRPTLFGGYIAIDPSQWWDNYIMLQRAEESFKKTRFEHKIIFLATQNESYPVHHFPTALNQANIADILSQNNPKGLNWTHQQYINENHHTLQLVAFMDGLKYIFDGHKPTLDTLYSNPEKLQQQYDMLSQKLGTKIAPNEGAVSFMGFNLMRHLKRPDIDNALIHFQLNTRNYPKSSIAWSNLGQGLVQANRHIEARAAFETALKINAENRTAIKLLEELKR